jgi:hypothetical protein
VTELSEESLEAQWREAKDPFERTFAALMLGIARGFDSGMNPAFDKFPMKMTSAREWIEEHARPSSPRFNRLAFSRLDAGSSLGFGRHKGLVDRLA